MQGVDGRTPSEIDQALLRVVTEALDELPHDVATLSHEWGDPAGMWFVEVRPRIPTAAKLHVGFDGGDIVNFTVGSIWFEVFPVKAVEDLDYVRDIASAVFHGQVEESGPVDRAFGRIFLSDGPLSVGHIQVRWPWSARPPKRTYAPYA